MDFFFLFLFWLTSNKVYSLPSYCGFPYRNHANQLVVWWPTTGGGVVSQINQTLNALEKLTV